MIEGDINIDEDRYPEFNKVLAALKQATDLGQLPVEHLEVHCHASGDATYKVWLQRVEEPDGGFIPADEIR